MADEQQVAEDAPQEEFADWFTRTMDPEAGAASEDQSGEAPPEQPEADDVQSDEPVSEDGEPPAQEAGEEPAEDESEDSEQATEDSEESEAQRFTVKANGQEQEVTLDELLSGYSRQSDYTAKTQALAEERKALEAREAALASQQQQNIQSLAEIKDTLAQQAGILSKEEIKKLHDEGDFTQWSVEDRRREAFEKQFDQQAQGQTAVLQQQQAKAVQDCWTEISKGEIVTEWSDLEAATPEIRSVANYIASQGVPADQVQWIANPLIWAVSRKAMLYDKLMADKPAVTKKVAKAPRMQKPGTPKSAKQSASDQVSKAAARLEKTGEGFAEWLQAAEAEARSARR